jgi:hypothetical protein
MIRMFLENRVLVLLFLPFIVGIYFLLNFQTGYYAYFPSHDFGLWSNFFSGHSWIYSFLSFIIIIFNAISLNWVFNKNEFLERNSYIVSLLYVVTMSFYHSFYVMDGLLLAHLFFILMFIQLLQIKQTVDARIYVFNGCLFAGLSATFHPPIMLGLPFFIAMPVLIRPFNFREFLIGITGFGIPLVYGFVNLWFQNNSLSFSFFTYSEQIKLHADFVITLLVIGILFSLSIFSLRSRLQKSSLRLKNQIRLIWVFIWITIILGSLNFYFFLEIEHFSLLMIPISLLLSYSFLHKNYGIIATIVFYLTIIYSVIKFFILNPYQSL